MDEKTIKKFIGLRIKQLRKKLKLTQFELGEKTSIDQRQIAYIEGGNCLPSLKTMIKLSEVFNCQIKDLFDYEHLMDIEKDLNEEMILHLSKLDEKNLKLYHQIMKVLENNISN